MSNEYKFKIKEGTEADFETLKSHNTDACGSTIIALAEHWGSMMEDKIKEGFTVAEAAEATWRDAAMWNVSGTMFSYAKGVLATYWEHGDEFLDWNDNKYNCNSRAEQEPVEQSDGDIEMKGY